jgi:hypothetical protein
VTSSAAAARTRGGLCATSPARLRCPWGYLSEVERGQKEASSELLAAICGALEVSLSDVLASVSTHVAEAETESPRTPSLV